MFKKIGKGFLVCLLGMSIQNASAKPIEGNVKFSTTGTHVLVDPGAPAHLQTISGMDDMVGEAIITATGALSANVGLTPDMVPSWRFSTFPNQLEWSLVGAIVDGFIGTLTFYMDTGKEVDISSFDFDGDPSVMSGFRQHESDLGKAGVNLWGKGHMKFACDSGANDCSTALDAASATGDANGFWNLNSLTEEPGSQLSFASVPAPATIGLLGLGLLGLGAVRRRNNA
jgi:hypothetical protein